VSKRTHGAECSEQDCLNVAIARGLCNKHYQRWLKYNRDKVRRYSREGFIVRKNGYRAIWAPDHPMANSDGYVAEHRMVVHDAGIPIPPGHHVHHKNGDKRDNRLENLEVALASDHHRTHVREAGFVVNQYGRWPLKG
jgi:hypothetical protein